MFFDTGGRSAYQQIPVQEEKTPLPKDLNELSSHLNHAFSQSDDFILQRLTIHGCGVAVALFDGLVSNSQVSDLLLRPMSRIPSSVHTPEEVYQFLWQGGTLAGERKELADYETLETMAMSGFAVVAVEGTGKAVALGYQGFSARGIDEPSGERNLRGSREGFGETIVQNAALIRRRMKTSRLVIEGGEVGRVSRTKIKLLYLRGMVPEQMVEQVRQRLAEADLDLALDTSYLRPFLDDRKSSVFSGTGFTERPDTLCAKLEEGRIGILMDGTPFALIVPYLFLEHFQVMDDYTHRPYFALFLRTLRLVCFLTALFLPGIYVAVVTWHPELIPGVLLGSFLGSVLYTPLPAFGEALMVFLLYEMLREAGLRLPQPLGNAISVVGGLVIGDAAVTAGIVGLPMLIIIALTAVSSFALPSIYEPVTVLRLLFILAGGFFGLLGIALGFGVLVINLCGITTMGIPITSPVSPFDPKSMRDMLVRSGWKKLGQPIFSVWKTPGAENKR